MFYGYILLAIIIHSSLLTNLFNPQLLTTYQGFFIILLLLFFVEISIIFYCSYYLETNLISYKFIIFKLNFSSILYLLLLSLLFFLLLLLLFLHTNPVKIAWKFTEGQLVRSIQNDNTYYIISRDNSLVITNAAIKHNGDYDFAYGFVFVFGIIDVVAFFLMLLVLLLWMLYTAFFFLLRAP